MFDWTTFKAERAANTLPPQIQPQIQLPAEEQRQLQLQQQQQQLQAQQLQHQQAQGGSMPQQQQAQLQQLSPQQGIPVAAYRSQAAPAANQQYRTMQGLPPNNASGAGAGAGAGGMDQMQQLSGVHQQPMGGYMQAMGQPSPQQPQPLMYSHQHQHQNQNQQVRKPPGVSPSDRVLRSSTKATPGAPGSGSGSGNGMPMNMTMSMAGAQAQAQAQAHAQAQAQIQIQQRYRPLTRDDGQANAGAHPQFNASQFNAQR
ncbi:hypothetical protein GGF37_005084 [Kickxella alabastrina]|nr:hypothetical protein GGF37_005084 [Kickxella alabastrina]